LKEGGVVGLWWRQGRGPDYWVQYGVVVLPVGRLDSEGIGFGFGAWKGYHGAER